MQSRCPQPFLGTITMIFLSRSWHGSNATRGAAATIATIAGSSHRLGKLSSSASFPQRNQRFLDREFNSAGTAIAPIQHCRRERHEREIVGTPNAHYDG